MTSRRGNLSRARRGMTLIEVLVALVVIAIIATLAGLQVRPAERADPDAPGSRIRGARNRAIRTGQRVTFTSDSLAGTYAVALPDGSVIADSTIPVERLTGMPRLGETKP